MVKEMTDLGLNFETHTGRNLDKNKGCSKCEDWNYVKLIGQDLPVLVLHNYSR